MRIAVRSLTLLLFFSLASCAGIKIEQSRSLAETGAQSAAALQRSALAVYEGFLEAPKLDALDKALVTGVPNVGTRMDPTQFKKIADALKARVDVATSLVGVYGSFSKLANYDASKEMEAALGGLFGSVNQFLAVFEQRPISQLAGEVTKISGGLIAAEIQRAKLLKANELILAALRSYHAALSAPANREAITSLSKDVVAKRYNVAKELWRLGLLSAEPVVASLVSKQGLALKTSDRISYTSANRHLGAALRAYFDLERDRQRDLVDEEYDTTVSLVEALIREHEAFGKGDEFDLKHLIAIMQRLQSIVERIKIAIEADRKARN